MQHICRIFNKNTQNYERTAIEINERENIQDVLIDTLSHHLQKNYRNDFFLSEIFNGESIHPFSTWKSLRIINTSHKL